MMTGARCPELGPEDDGDFVIFVPEPANQHLLRMCRILSEIYKFGIRQPGKGARRQLEWITETWKACTLRSKRITLLARFLDHQ